MARSRDRTVGPKISDASTARPFAPDVFLDPYKSFVFPNRVREQRRAKDYLKLLRFAASIPEIPYIRLSKIERGEVFPRADELRRIAEALDIQPSELLLDIDDPTFDFAAWVQPFEEGKTGDAAEERFAALLGAALRAHRSLDPALTIAAIERDFGLPPVNLSRVENASKTFARWNDAVRASLFAIFGVEDESALRSHVAAVQRSGALEPFLAVISNPEERRAKTRARTLQLLQEFQRDAQQPPPVPPANPGDGPGNIAPIGTPRLLPVHGVPMPGGLIAFTPTGEMVEAPRAAGPGAFALRVCRQTLGGGLPAQAIVIVDPARYPVAGGLAAVNEGGAWRLLAVTIDRHSALSAYSINPEITVSIDGHEPGTIAAVVAAIFP